MRISLAVAAMAMAGVGAMKTYGAYTAANMSDSELLLMENVEALSSCEFDGINIKTYNVNSKEDWAEATVHYKAGFGWYIKVAGEKINVGAEAKTRGTAFYSVCSTSPCNVCAKSWAKDIQVKYM